jgi:uncharacterized Fe-S center protein
MIPEGARSVNAHLDSCGESTVPWPIMSAEVFFVELPENSTLEQRLVGTERLLDGCGLKQIVAKRDRVAVKIHVGEGRNNTHLAPRIVGAVVERLKRLGTSPFLTETSTLYKGNRSNAIDHLTHAYEHGFGYEVVGAPFIMADGLSGNSEVEVPIPGVLFQKVNIAREAVFADALVAVTHAKGHLANALGGTIKNVGMGLSSRMGKLRQHSAMKPKVDPKACTLCLKCIRWCPVEAIVEREGKAFILTEPCIGCGECLAVCRFDAVKYDWGTQGTDLQRKEAEHALGVVLDKRDKCLFLNFLVDMTRDCDCMDRAQERIQPDLGILASQDAVAVDQATLDLTRERFGRSLAEEGWPHLDATVQLEHGERVGLGSRRYELRMVGAR